MKNAALSMQRLFRWSWIPFVAVLALAGCSRAFLPGPRAESRPAHQTIPSYLSATRLLDDEWYRRFLQERHRKPVVELIQTVVSDTSSARWLSSFQTAPVYLSIQQTQISLLDSFPQNLKEALLSSEKVALVTTRVRRITHLERFFQMQHASSNSLKEPGQIRGADYAVIIFPSVSVPVVQRVGFRVLASWSVSFELQLIDLETDNEVWNGQVRLFYDGRSGHFDSFVSSSNPHLAMAHLRVLHNRWVPVE
jgi:hypothetical protein